MTLGIAQTVISDGSTEWMYIVIPISVIVVFAIAVLALRRKQK